MATHDIACISPDEPVHISRERFEALIKAGVIRKHDLTGLEPTTVPDTSAPRLVFIVEPTQPLKE